MTCRLYTELLPIGCHLVLSNPSFLPATFSRAPTASLLHSPIPMCNQGIAHCSDKCRVARISDEQLAQYDYNTNHDIQIVTSIPTKNAFKPTFYRARQVITKKAPKGAIVFTTSSGALEPDA